MKKKHNYRLVTIYIAMVFLLVSSSFLISINHIVNAVVVEDIEIGNSVEENDSSNNEETKPDTSEEEEIVEQQEEEAVPSNPVDSATLEITIESPVEGDLFNDKKITISGSVVVPIPETDNIPEQEIEQDPEVELDPDGVPDPDIIPESEGIHDKKNMQKFETLIEHDVVTESEGVTESENMPELENTPEPENILEQENKVDSTEVKIEIYEKVEAETETEDQLLGIVEMNGTGGWSFTLESEDVFSDGNHTIYAIVKDELGNSAISDEVSFFIDTIRPFVWIQNHPYDQQEDKDELILAEDKNFVTNDISIQEELIDDEGLTENEDAPKIGCPPPTPNMTRVCLNSSIVIYVEDDQPLYEENGEIIDNLKITGEEGNPKQFFRLYSSDGNEQIEYDIQPVVNLLDEEKAKKLVKITLIVPKGKQLKPFTTYYVAAGEIKDKAGNFVHTRIWKFTTGNETDGVVFDEKDPHGNYKNNVNFCVNCHSAHAAEKEKLITGKSPSKEAYFCNSCHDGTVAQPEMLQAPEIVQKDYNHPFKVYEKDDDSGEYVAVVKDLSENNGSCSTCHDPHLTWNEENPNLLKSHYIFPNHEPVEGYDKEFDSQVVLCETCHYDGSGMTMRNGDKVRNGYEVKNAVEEGVIYEVFQYKGSSTLEGTVEVEEARDSSDYSLCLRCHFNPDTNNINLDIKDINLYYSDPDSGHFFEAKDRAKLSLYMPCAECHDTHGSSNKQLIKGKLGHENPKEFAGKGDLDWTPELEEQFCLTCHNTQSIDENKKTLIFGIDAKFDETIEGHGKGEACSACHGGDSKSFSEAVHAPQKLTK